MVTCYFLLIVILCAVPPLTLNFPACWRGGGLQALATGNDFRLRTNFQASYCPACATPQLPAVFPCCCYIFYIGFTKKIKLPFRCFIWSFYVELFYNMLRYRKLV